MKATGARIVARTPILAMCFSTSYLLSKCGTPVRRLAEATEVKTRCTPAALAASAAATPCRVSASVPPNGVVIAKREVAPSRAFVIAAVSSSDAATSVAPAFASDFAWLEFGFARDGAALVASLKKAPRDGAALFTRGSRDEDS